MRAEGLRGIARSKNLRTTIPAAETSSPADLVNRGFTASPPDYDEPSRQWISRAEVAEIEFTAFGSPLAPERTLGRLVVRRIPDLREHTDGQGTSFDT
jgi:hypothetical protein